MKKLLGLILISTSLFAAKAITLSNAVITTEKDTLAQLIKKETEKDKKGLETLLNKYLKENKAGEILPLALVDVKSDDGKIANIFVEGKNIYVSSKVLKKITDKQAQDIIKAQNEFNAVAAKAQKEVNEAGKKLENVYKGILK